MILQIMKQNITNTTETPCVLFLSSSFLPPEINHYSEHCICCNHVFLHTFCTNVHTVK